MEIRVKAPEFNSGMQKVYPHTMYTKTMGADPEFFVEDPDGGIIPAFKFLPSQKEYLDLEKIRLGGDYIAFQEAAQKSGLYNPNMGNCRNSAGGFTYWDGYQAEFSCRQWTCNDGGNGELQAGLASILQKLHQKGLKGKLSNQTAPYIPVAVRKKASEEHNALGCKPSFNAYDRAGMPVDDPSKLKYRFSGGHIHLGGFDYSNSRVWDSRQKVQQRDGDPKAFWTPTVKSLDKVLGIWSVCAFSAFDKEVRRQYYGLPGEFRAPKHGLEYRTLSNAWLMFGPAIGYLTMGIARETAALHDEDDMKFWIADEEAVFDAIRYNDVKSARKILRVNQAMFEWLVPLGVAAGSGHEAYRIAEQGVGEFMEEPTNVAANWGITSDGSIGNSNTIGRQWGPTSRNYLAKGHKIPPMLSVR